MALPGSQLTDEAAYGILNKAILPAWVLLALFPKAKLTNAVVMATGLGMAAAYAVLVAAAASQGSLDLSTFESLENLSKAFQTATTLLPAWVHYLAQDLFVARWMAGDACNKRIPRLAMLPVLALALLLGPAGPLLYFLLVRPLLAKSATTPKGTGKAKAAAPAAVAQQAAPAKNGKQPAAAQQAQPAAAPAKKNGSLSKEAPAPAPAAPQQQQQQKPQQAKAKKGGLSAYALAAAEAAAGPAPKKTLGAGTAAAGGKNGKAQAAAAAPKPVERDIEDDRAFAMAAAALLASRAKPQK